ncbi:MAG: hemin-degrading factor [Planctomycetales bacterium]|nr:hemin-degrading factor [Planctomycetales bacterium]
METRPESGPAAGEGLLAILESALALGDVRAIVRSEGATAEIVGRFSLRRGEVWLTVGEESGSHAHVRTADVRSLAYVRSEGRNAGLEVRGPEGRVLLKLSFARTNLAKPGDFDPARLDAVESLLGRLPRSGIL